MRFVIVAAAALLLQPSTGAAAGPCCDEHKSCATTPCCRDRSVEVALEPMGTELGVVVPGLESPDEEAPPARELAEVLFRDPVRVGHLVLFGKYVIEHDKDRMAQGLPCTHIYEYEDRRLPVVAFHCRHVVRKAGPKATVTLQRLPDAYPRIFKLVEFQFEGSTEGHGVPIDR